MRDAMTKLGFVKLVLFWSGCAGPEGSVGVGRWPIAGGVPDTEHRATVLLRGPGVDCSGSLVGPHTVVTAKHCVADRPEGWTVISSAGPEGAQRCVIDIVTTPGDELVGEDIAVLTLDGDIEVTPYPIRRDASDLEPGESLVLVGYGLRPSRGVGERYMGESPLLSIGPTNRAGDGEIVTLGAAASCHGDSGGSVLDSDGRLVGVISGGFMEQCSEEDWTIATRVDIHLGMVRDVLGLGAPCDRTADCREGECLARSAGEEGICTRRCDGVDPLDGCPPGSYCDRSGDIGLCVLGWPGSARLWDECTSDHDCASLLCHSGQCREACSGDGDCGFGMVCERADADLIGACFSGGTPADGPSDAARPVEIEATDVGAVCSENHDCATGLCGHWPDGPVCTARCDDDDACPEDFACVAVESEQLCAPAERERRGSSCSLAPPSRGCEVAVALLAAVALLLGARAKRPGERFDPGPSD
jgi:hypothetical protein